jgi:hypothetical protein
MASDSGNDDRDEHDGEEIDSDDWLPEPSEEAEGTPGEAAPGGRFQRQRPPRPTWAEVRAEASVNHRAIEHHERMMAMEGTLVHLCAVYLADEREVMVAAGVTHEEEYATIVDRGDGLFIARIGRAVAQIGGQLQIDAVFPDARYSLLTEPTLDDPGSAVPSDAHPLPEIPEHVREIGWRASPYYLQNDPEYAPAFQRLATLEETLWQICKLRDVDEAIVIAAIGGERQPDQTHIPIRDGGLYLANLGEVVALIGGHLEMRAVFPEESHVLLLEPGLEHLHDHE